MPPERKTAGLTARAVVALVIHVIIRGDPTGSRRTRERGGVGRETIPNKKRATEAQTAEKQRVLWPRIGDRATHVRGARWVHNNSLPSSRATRFGDFINMRGCLASFAWCTCAACCYWRGDVEQQWKTVEFSETFPEVLAIRCM